MSGELKHTSAGVTLTQAEYESIDSHTLDSAVQGDMIYHNGTRLMRLPQRWVDVKVHGAVGDAATDDAPAIQALLTAGYTSLYFPPGVYRINTTLQINNRGVTLKGHGKNRANEGAASVLRYYGTGPLIQIGTDSGNPYTDVEYDGPQGTVLEDLYLHHNAPDTLLLGQGVNSYKTGSYGVRDWRGGGVHLNRVMIEYFQYGFWGVQSDINRFHSTRINYCSVGAYLGPRCDQLLWDLAEFIYCDTAIKVDTMVRQLNIRGLVAVGCGSLTTYPIQILQGITQLVLNHPWFEHYQGYNGEIIAFIGSGLSAGYGSATDVGTLVIDYPVVNTAVQGATRHTKYLANVGNTRVVVREPDGTYYNLAKLLASADANTPIFHVEHSRDHSDFEDFIFVQNGAGVPRVTMLLHQLQHLALGATSGRLYLRTMPPNTLRDFYMCAPNDQQISVVFPDDASGNTTRFQVARRIVAGGAAPVASAWDRGDIVINHTPSAAGYAGWICVVAGTPGTWKGFGLIEA